VLRIGKILLRIEQGIVFFEFGWSKLSLWNLIMIILMLNTMANTYTQCYFHLVFAVKNRNALIKKEWKDELDKYITVIIQNHRHKMLAIGSMPDHIHILIGYNVNQLIPDLVEEIKTSSNSLIKVKRLSKFRFEWQKGYGSFTHSHSQIDNVVKYILTQEEHHKKKPFKEEYWEMLEKNNVEFNQEYLFEFFNDTYEWN
jgi:REP element-mobilizing transposase RayT